MNSPSSNSRVKLISHIALFVSIGFGIVGQLLMKQAMSNTAVGFFTWSFILQLALALTTYSLGIINWIFALRVVKLSIAYPLTSLNYVGILFGSSYFFDEQITLIRVFGVVLIFLGVLLVAIPAQNRRRVHGSGI